jgi:tetratricopeptide (TPR) repeat protein
MAGVKLCTGMARTGYDALGLTRNVTMTFGAVLIVAMTLVYMRYCWQSVTLIDPIAVPPGLGTDGVTAATAQQQFNEDLLSILDSASGVMPTEIHQSIVDSGQEELHLEIPGTGLSVEEIMRAAKELAHRDGHITAQIVRDGKALHMSGRVIRPGGESHAFSADSPDGNVKEVIEAGAKAAMFQYNPYVLASSILDQTQKDCERNGICEYTAATNAYWDVLRSGSLDDTMHLRKWAYLGLSKIAEDKLDFLTEIEHARQAIALDRNFSWARYNWGVALENLGCYAEAREKFSAVIRDKSSYAAGHNALGRQYLRVARLLPQPVISNRVTMPPQANPARLAQLEFEAATALDPRYGEAFRNLGEALGIQGRPDDALTQLQNAVSVDIEHSGKAYEQIEAIEARRGSSEMARHAHQEAVASDWENLWCRGNVQSNDASSHGCGNGFMNVAIQASIHNVPDWPKVDLPDTDCKMYADEGGP